MDQHPVASIEPIEAAQPVAAHPVRRYSRQDAGPTPRWAWFGLAAIVLAGLLLRLPGLGAPIVGYHSFNEAFYVGNALRDLNGGVFAPWSAPYALNPPLYAFLLRLALSVFGPTILVARALSVAAALATAVALFFLGKRIYGVSAGLGAAAVIALAPGSVLVGRNIQIESVLALVLTLVALAWVTAADEDSVPWAVVAGVLAGLALLLKMQGLMILPAIALAEVIRTRSLRRLWSRVSLFALAAFGAVGLPWHVWSLLQPGRATALGVRTSETGVPNLYFLDMFFAREWFWFLSPLLTVAVVAGLAYLIRRRRPSDVLVLLAVSANVAFYFVYHLHTYYLYSALPFVALCAGALLEPLARRNLSAVVASLCVVALLTVPFALTELMGKKLGYWSSDQIAASVADQGIDPADTTLAVENLFRASWEPALLYNARGMGIVSNPLRGDDVLVPGTRIVSLDAEPRPASADSVSLVRLADTHVMPVFFGYGVDQSHEALFFFAVDQPRFVRVGPWWKFGLASRTDPIDRWASLLSPAFTDRIRADATAKKAAAPDAP